MESSRQTPLDLVVAPSQWFIDGQLSPVQLSLSSQVQGAGFAARPASSRIKSAFETRKCGCRSEVADCHVQAALPGVCSLQIMFACRHLYIAYMHP